MNENVFKGFGLRRVNINIVKRSVSKEPAILEGREALETLCPVSSLTGHRMNPIQLLGMVTPSNERLVGSILQELPVVQQMDAPDSVKIEQLVPAEFGTFAERDAVIQNLSSIADVLFKKPESSDSKIEFSPSDAAPAAE